MKEIEREERRDLEIKGEVGVREGRREKKIGIYIYT